MGAGWILALTWVVGTGAAQDVKILREPPAAYADERACNTAREAILGQRQPAGVTVLVACRPAG